MVTFTDMVDGAGGSSGRDPCNVTIGPSVLASASSRGPGLGMGWSLSMSASGPQVSGGCALDSDSDITGSGSRGAARLVV